MQEDVSSRMSRILEHFKNLWQQPHELSVEVLEKIIVGLPEEGGDAGIETITEYLVNFLKLHFLDIVATFQQKAVEEGMGVAERDEIVRDAMTESFQTVQKLGKLLSVQTVGELLLLSNITFGLYALSQSETAEKAQGWIYKLPKIYRNRLEREHLIADRIQATVMVSAIATKSQAYWSTALSPSTNWTVQSVVIQKPPLVA